MLPVLRESASYYVLLGQFGDKNLKHLAEELHPASGHNEKDFMEKWHEAHKEPFDFMMLDFRKMKTYRNLTDLLYSKDDERQSKQKEQAEQSHAEQSDDEFSDKE